MTRVAVAGLGLIGGSIALASGARGFDRDPRARDHAAKRGIETAGSLAEAVADADIVVTAVPTAETPALLQAIGLLAPAALLTDTASLKRPIVAASQDLPPGVRFVAGHPMAGARGHGLAAASAKIFRGRPWALVRTPRSDDRAIADVSAFVASLGARPILLEAETHDHAMTWVSHLPHAVASALALATAAGGGADLRDVAGPGLLDATRLADQPIPLGLELALADPAALARAIDAVSGELGRVSAALGRGDAQALRALFEEAAAIRRSLEP